MDLSKLPKLSKTTEAERPAAQQPPTTAAEPPLAHLPPALPAQAVLTGGWGEAWLSIGIGIFLLFFQPRFLQWLSSSIFHTHFNEFHDLDSNNIVPYQTLPEFWSDLGLTLFGVVLLLDGLLMFTRRRSLCWFALGLTTASTVLNLVWCVGSFSEYGFAPISFLAVVFGVFMAAAQWRMLRSLGPLPTTGM
jgi:hypothetical protein